MASVHPAGPPLRLACHQFLDKDVEALRSLLGLLDKYLRRRWEVVEWIDASADAILVNLDHPRSEPAPTGPYRIGCAAKPSLRSGGCIHRPLRAAEVLAVLNEITQARQASPSSVDETCPHRLLAWPSDLDVWPHDARRVMAAITARPASALDIADRTGLALDDVRSILVTLRKSDLLDADAGQAASAGIANRAAAPGRWRALASRVGRLLGLAQ